MFVAPTYDSSRLRRLDERQRAVVRLLGDVDEALLELVPLQDAVELVEEPHPLGPLLVAVGQDQDGGLVAAGGGQLGRRHLRKEEDDEESHRVFERLFWCLTSLLQTHPVVITWFLWQRHPKTIIRNMTAHNPDL